MCISKLLVKTFNLNTTLVYSKYFLYFLVLFISRDMCPLLTMTREMFIKRQHHHRMLSTAMEVIQTRDKISHIHHI